MARKLDHLLPGDERGYCTWRKQTYVPPPKRYAKPGEPTYTASDHTAVRERARAIAEQPVYFTQEQLRIAFDTMVAEIAEIENIVPSIMSLASWHAHWLCHFGPGVNIRSVMGRIKAAATRELNRRGFQGKRPWTKGGNMRSKRTRLECRTAYRYILQHREQGCLIYKWNIDPRYLTFA